MPPSHQRGFTYLGLLFVVALLGILLASAGEVWHTTMQREREAELLAIGNQFREAFRRYYQDSPDNSPRYPQTLDDLLLDRRFVTPRRHLRRIYADPMTGHADWALIRQQDRIVGVHSLSAEGPLKSAGFLPRDEQLAGAKNYAQWRFSYLADLDTWAASNASKAETNGGAQPNISKPNR